MVESVTHLLAIELPVGDADGWWLRESLLPQLKKSYHCRQTAPFGSRHAPVTNSTLAPALSFSLGLLLLYVKGWRSEWGRLGLRCLHLQERKISFPHFFTRGVPLAPTTAATSAPVSVTSAVVKGIVNTNVTASVVWFWTDILVITDGFPVSTVAVASVVMVCVVPAAVDSPSVTSFHVVCSVVVVIIFAVVV